MNAMTNVENRIFFKIIINFFFESESLQVEVKGGFCVNMNAVIL